MRTERVCLIIPPSPFLLDERVFMHIGILKIAAVLERKIRHVEVLDLSGYTNYLDAITEHVRSSPVEYFGITATTPQLPAAVEISKIIHGIRPGARVILGGPHATLVSTAKKRDEKRGRIGRAHRAYMQLTKYFDVLVAGDGEHAIFLALEPDAPELIDADDRHSSLFLTNTSLDATPFPARHLVDVGSYRYSIEGVSALSLIAQLGCPYKCGFCAGRNSPMLRNIRTRSAENIVEEMELLYQQYGCRGFMLYDDELNVSQSMPDLMDAIARKQRDLKTEWRLRGFVKSELFNEVQAEALYKAGFRWLLVGFESGSPRILKNIQKIATQEDNTRCMEIARRFGLSVKALMSVGHPGESIETIEESRRWLINERPADFDVSIITPYPGSPYYDEASVSGDFEEDVFTYTCRNGDRLHQRDVDYTQKPVYYKGDPNDGYVSHVFTDDLTETSIVCERDKFERDVRGQLGIPYNPDAVATLYEHSMGQTALPSRMLRTSRSNAP